MSRNIAVARSALKLGFFISSLTIASLGARLAAADISPGGESRAFGIAAARAANGDLSDQTLHRIFDAEGSPLFARHDPGVKQAAAFDILKGYEASAPLSHWDLTPQEAEVVNQSTPVSGADNSPAKPFVFRGGAGDRQMALACLTQAVYYEAGFEPLAGAQAVAQVVLNRVRHPIFPKSICGVVYQGATLKTGCQFSFACDGSLAKTPAKGAWDRAKTVAEQALNGFVEKDVGEATHYHTQSIMPWWASSVSKVAQVGTQIFYRWPGPLGMPAAFVGRYAGGEHMGRAPQDKGSSAPTGTPLMASTADHGRVHAVFTAAIPISAPPVVKTEVAALDPTRIKAQTPEVLSPSGQTP